MTPEEFAKFKTSNPHVKVYWVTAFKLNHNDALRKPTRNLFPTKCILDRSVLFKAGKNGAPMSASVAVDRNTRIFLTKEEAVKSYVAEVEVGYNVVSKKLNDKTAELRNMIQAAEALLLTK